jgi:hypothetical protein
MRTLLCVALLAVGCHSSKPPANAAAPASQGQSNTQKINAMLARENPALARRDVAMPDGSASAKVESAGVPTIAPEGDQLVLNVPIGTSQPVVCRVAKQVDLASSLQKVFSAVEKFPKREITTTDAGVMHGAPFLMLTTLYLVEPQRLLGQVKMYAFRREGQLGVLCTHDEPGYSATVRKVVDSVAETLQLKDAPPPPAPVCRELVVTSINGRKVGVMSEVMTRLKDGRWQEISGESSLRIATPTEFSGVDRYEVTHIRGDFVEDALYVDATGGAETLELNLKLQKVKPGTYHVTGLFKGKQIDVSFDAPDWYSSVKKSALVREKILGKKNVDLVLTTYTPGTDPSGVDHETVRALPDGTYQILDTEKLRATVVFDEDGQPIRMTAKIASQELVMERVLMEGKCP